MWIQMLLQVSPLWFFMCKNTWLQPLAQCVIKHSAQGEKHLNNDSFLVKVTIWCNKYTILWWSTSVYAPSYTYKCVCPHKWIALRWWNYVKLLVLDPMIRQRLLSEPVGPHSTLWNKSCAHTYGLSSGFFSLYFLNFLPLKAWTTQWWLFTQKKGVKTTYLLVTALKLKFNPCTL